MDWIGVLEHAIKTLVIGGAVLLVGAIIKIWSNKSLHEHAVRFSKLHNERGEVIKQLYSKLVKMENSIRSYMNPFQYENAPSEEEQQKITAKAAGDFIWFYDENRIFFEIRLCDLIEEIYTIFRKAWIDFHIYQNAASVSRAVQSAKSELQLNAYKNVREKLPELRKQLEDDFRILLGVNS